jgi:hypothetical protein
VVGRGLPRGEDKGADWVEKALGWSVDVVERPKKPAPEAVLKSWAREWAKEDVALEGVMNFSSGTVASGHGYSKTIPKRRFR